MKVRMNEWKYTSMNLRVKVNVWMNEWETHSVKDPLSEIWKKTDLCRINSFYNWIIKHVFTILNRHNGKKIVSG